MTGSLSNSGTFPSAGLATLESYLIDFPGEFDVRGKAELRADSGLTLIYGRNGSGKSSVLRTIKEALSGIAPNTPDDPGCLLVLRLADWHLPAGASVFERQFRGCSEFIRQVAHSALQHTGFDHDWEEEDYRKEFIKWAKYFIDLDPNITDLPNGWLSVAESYRPQATSTAVYEECLSFLTRSRDRLLIVPLIEDAIFMSYVCSMEEGSERFNETIQLIRIVLRDPVLILSAAGTQENPQWRISIATANQGPDSDLGLMCERQKHALRKYQSEFGAHIFDELEALEADLLPLPMLRKNRIAEKWGSRYVVLEITSSTSLRVKELPFRLIDANEVEDVVTKLNSELVGNFLSVLAAFYSVSATPERDVQQEEDDEETSSESDETESEADVTSSGDAIPIIGLSGTEDPEKEAIATNEEAIRGFLRIAQEALLRLSECDIRIGSRLHLRAHTSLQNLKRGRFLDLSFYEFPDLQGPFDVTFENLSSGQRQLINLAFAATLSSQDDSGQMAILVGDEVDTGVHVRSIVGLYRMLSLMPISCICSTHSIDAIAQSIGRRVHLTRDDETGIQIQEFNILNAKEASAKMGVTVSSLLAFFRVILIVEGEHDRILFQTVLSAQGIAVGTDVVVLPIRGVSRLMTSLEAELLDYSDAKILVVLDNVRQEVVAELIRTATTPSPESTEGTRSKLLAVRSKCETHEEQIVGDLIVRKHLRGHVSKITVRGLSRRDVIEYLDPKEFGLTQDWNELRSEYSQLKSSDPMSKSSFKDYLRVTKGASISNETVAVAAQNLGALHPDLVALIEQVSDLLRGRNFEIGFGI